MVMTSMVGSLQWGGADVVEIRQKLTKSDAGNKKPAGGGSGDWGQERKLRDGVSLPSPTLIRSGCRVPRGLSSRIG
jgi:hypothetical protein